MTRPSDKKRLQPWMVGLIAVALTVFGFYLGFTKQLPFTGNGYEISAVFSNAQNIRIKSPVREAGVNVGTVTDVKHLVTDGKGQQAAVVTMQIDDAGQPIKQDATLQLRPRLFLEGNLFVDLHPGTPQSPELKSGGTIPIAQTSTSVQLDQVLTTLQAPVRQDLQTFLVEFGNSLYKYGGGKGLQDTFRSSPTAFRDTSYVNEALLGTQPGDLSGLIVNFDSFSRALNQNQSGLQNLVTNLATVTSAFGQEDRALETAVFTLPRLLGVGTPALLQVNNALPSLRAFSRELLPGVRSAGPALDAANPFIAQLRGLVSPNELRGLTAALVPTVPSLAKLSQVTIPFFEQARTLSSCFNNVVIPWGDKPVPTSDGAPQDPVYKQTGYGLAGLGGESRSGDANGQAIRVGVGSGSNIISTPPIPGEGTTVGQTVLPLLGAEPSLGSSAKTPFHPNTPCETQAPPDLRSGGPVAVPGQSSTARSYDASKSATLPSYLAPFLKQQAAGTTDVLAGQRQGGKAGKALETKGYTELQSFYKNVLPQYLKALHGGGH